MMLTVGATAAFADDPISVPAGEGDQSYKGAKVIVADTEGHAYLNLTKVLEVKEGMAPDKMTFNFTVEGTSATGSVDFKRTDNNNSAAFTAGEYKRTFNIDLMQVLAQMPRRSVHILIRSARLILRFLVSSRFVLA